MHEQLRQGSPAQHPPPLSRLRGKQPSSSAPADSRDPLDSMVLRLFVLVALVLVVFPFWLPLQDVLIHWIIRMGWYRPIQQYIAYQLHYITVFLTLLGFPLKHSNQYISWQKGSLSTEAIYFTWNCVGGQSFLLFFVTALTGLSGKHTLFSKWETFLLGLVGTYLFMMLRLMAVLVVYIPAGRPLGVVFHDYVTILFSFGWLACFWWFAYHFVLKAQPTLPPAQLKESIPAAVPRSLRESKREEEG